MKVNIDEKSSTFNIVENNVSKFLLPKPYLKYWKIDKKFVLIKNQKGYYLISAFHICYFIYDGEIKEITCNDEDRINIISKSNTVLRIVLDAHNTNLMVEIYNIDKFQEDYDKKTSYLMLKYKYRYIPFVIDIE